ncbi:YdeI/OmpD-associated family protein [Actinocorallia longicatena]|uniref:YdeI/OmpD-associated family protein n=2 Tax=Actinocorallia longicatena TaxID=111803 RepID=A0ABP6QL22_9ACTN
MEPIFFTSTDAFRSWLEEHHADAAECQVGLWKSHTGRSGLTWSQAVDQALCFGWIDGRGNSLGDDAWTIRFTPRKPRSNWSLVNIQKIADLTAQGLMHPAGVAAFERRDKDAPAPYSHEQRGESALAPEQQALFEKEAVAWEWFSAQAPSYRKAAVHWVTGAKRPETRERRLEQLIADSREELRVKPLRR